MKLIILVGFTLQFSLLFAQAPQDCCNKNIYTEDETMKLSAYGKALEKSILEKNPSDSSKIAAMTGDFKNDCCYSDSSIIKISDYLKELEKLDSINKIVPEVVVVVEEPIVVIPDPVKPVVTPKTTGAIVLFPSNSSQFKVSALDDILKEMKADPKLTLSIDGYTDATASSEFNLALSKRRAKAVKSYLVSKGIAANRITSNAHGEDHPVADNTSEEGKAQNRRATLSVK